MADRDAQEGASRPDPWPACPKCDGDGYTETWNDDQSDVVISLCSCQTGEAHDG